MRKWPRPSYSNESNHHPFAVLESQIKTTLRLGRKPHHCIMQWHTYRFWKDTAPSCLLHISRSDAPIGLRHSRRRIGIKPCNAFPTSRWDPIHICQTVAMRTFTSVGTVKESYILQLPLKDSCIVHVAPDRPTASRGFPDESPTGDVGSETHSH